MIFPALPGRANQHEVIVRGLHKRAVIRMECFSRRVKSKSG